MSPRMPGTQRCSGWRYRAPLRRHGRSRIRPRARSLVKSKAELRSQVMRWAPQTKYKFTSGEIEALVEYLDRSHYKLEK